MGALSIKRGTKMQRKSADEKMYKDKKRIKENTPSA